MSNIENYNSDNILVRNVIAGVLSILNKSIKYQQVWDDNTTEEITLPWMYDLGSSDERLMQDNYTHFGLSCYAKKIDGNFDMFPRGAIRLESTTIDSDNMCNRFVRGITTRVENGKITTYNSFLYSIPLTISLTAEVWCDNFTNMLKIEQSLREHLYRNKTFYVLFRGMRIGCCLGMPNDYSEQKNTEYSLLSETGEQKIKLTFNLVVETYQPVFDRTMEMPNEISIKNIGFDVNTLKLNDNNKSIKFKNVDEYMVGGLETYISWHHSSFNSDMCTINLMYKQITDSDGNSIDDEFKVIETDLVNNLEYYWHVPNVKNTSSAFDILYNINEENTIMLSEPVIKFDNNLSPIIINPGKFITTVHEIVFNVGCLDSDNNYDIIENAGKAIIENSKIINVIFNEDLHARLNFKNKAKYLLRIEDGINHEIYDEAEFSIF